MYAGHDIPLLIPGVGSQGGSAGDVVRTLKKIKYDLGLIRINSSSGIIHPWKKSGHIPEKWSSVCSEALSKMIEACKTDS